VALSSALEQPGLEANHSHLTSSEYKNGCRRADTPFLYDVLRDSITVTLLNKHQAVGTRPLSDGKFPDCRSSHIPT